MARNSPYLQIKDDLYPMRAYIHISAPAKSIIPPSIKIHEGATLSFIRSFLETKRIYVLSIKLN